VGFTTVLVDLNKWKIITSISNYKPDLFEAKQNYLNPFNSQTIISFSLKAKDMVSLDIVNFNGEKVKSL